MLLQALQYARGKEDTGAAGGAPNASSRKPKPKPKTKPKPKLKPKRRSAYDGRSGTGPDVSDESGRWWRG